MPRNMHSPVEAGFGKVDISPRIGVELCGYGAYLNRHSTRLLEPLYARALAVRKDGERWVLVSCDLIGFSASLVDAIRKRVHKQIGWHAHEVMVHATHTHSGPCTISELTGWGTPDPLYLELLPRLVAKACIEAVQNLRPSSFFHAEVPAKGFSYNRELPAPTRTNALVLEGKWTAPQPEETDTTAHVMRVEQQKKVVGFLSYFSCHPVVAGPNNREIHGDFVGIATNRVEQHYPGATGLFLQGAEGDINTNFVHGRRRETLRALEDFGARFAKVILQGIRAARPIKISDIRTSLTESPYHSAPISKDALHTKLTQAEAEIREATPSSTAPNARMAMVFIRAFRSLLKHPWEPDPLTAQTFTLGPISFTGLPLELMHRIKRRFHAQKGDLAFLLSVTNGFMGYAALREHYDPPARYSTSMVPYILGRPPFTPAMEDEVLTAALDSADLANLS